jgi:hypothetical protein
MLFQCPHCHRSPPRKLRLRPMVVVVVVCVCRPAWTSLRHRATGPPLSACSERGRLGGYRGAGGRSLPQVPCVPYFFVLGRRESLMISPGDRGLYLNGLSEHYSSRCHRTHNYYINHPLSFPSLLHVPPVPGSDKPPQLLLHCAALDGRSEIFGKILCNLTVRVVHLSSTLISVSVILPHSSLLPLPSPLLLLLPLSSPHHSLPSPSPLPSPLAWLSEYIDRTKISTEEVTV